MAWFGIINLTSWEDWCWRKDFSCREGVLVSCCLQSVWPFVVCLGIDTICMAANNFGCGQCELRMNWCLYSYRDDGSVHTIEMTSLRDSQDWYLVPQFNLQPCRLNTIFWLKFNTGSGILLFNWFSCHDSSCSSVASTITVVMTQMVPVLFCWNGNSYLLWSCFYLHLSSWMIISWEALDSLSDSILQISWICSTLIFSFTGVSEL